MGGLIGSGGSTLPPPPSSFPPHEITINEIKIKKVNYKETQVISRPYTSVNLLKNDYIKLKNFGFEELDIFINE